MYRKKGLPTEEKSFLPAKAIENTGQILVEEKEKEK